MTKEELNSGIWICGDIKHGNLHFNGIDDEIDIDFAMKLQELMFKYNVDKVDVAWRGTLIMTRV